MKIAYLMHSYCEYEELVESINQLIKQGDHVFIMINNNDLREKIHFVYAESPKVHISSLQEFAQEGDLSMARGTALQMREALDMGIFEYFINLSDGMMPIKPRSEIIKVLEEANGRDFYYIDRDEKQDPELRKKTLKYYTYTNLLSFPKKKFTRWCTKANATFLNAIGIRRKLADEMYIGSPWFMLNQTSAAVIVDNFPYISETFKLSWYAEEMYIPMMLHKYSSTKGHINDDYRVVGPKGKWIESQNTRPLTQEAINQYPNALFGGLINTESTLHLYEEYFDKYNSDLK